MLISGWIIHRSRWSRRLGSAEMEKRVCWASSRHLKNCFGPGFTEFGSGSRRFGESGSRIQIHIEDFDDQKLKFFVKRMLILFVLQKCPFFYCFPFLDCQFFPSKWWPKIQIFCEKNAILLFFKTWNFFSVSFFGLSFCLVESGTRSGSKTRIIQVSWQMLAHYSLCVSGPGLYSWSLSQRCQ